MFFLPLTFAYERPGRRRAVSRSIHEFDLLSPHFFPVLIVHYPHFFAV